MLSTEEDCDSCTLAGSRLLLRQSNAAYLSHGVFLTIFLFTATIVVRKGLPILATYACGSTLDYSSDAQLPLHKLEGRQRRSGGGMLGLMERVYSAKALTTLVFATNVGLSSVLVALLLCEISNLLDANARRNALSICLPLLVIQLVLVSPALQLQSVLAATGCSKRSKKVGWAMEIAGLLLWVLGFWYIGDMLLHLYVRPIDSSSRLLTRSREESLERIGVAGISLMACLSGLAAVSTVWQTFVAPNRIVTEIEINKRQTKLDVTQEMVQMKQTRMRILEDKAADAISRSGGIVNSMLGIFSRASHDGHEISMLQMEITGLEGLSFQMQNSLYSLRMQKTEQDKLKTICGRLGMVVSYGFGLYCVVRLATASIFMARQLVLTTDWIQQTAPNDPVTTLLGLLAKHWDSRLDREAWTRQLSFCLSGAMLLAAFNSALQTFLLLARAFPRLASSVAKLSDSTTTLALLISQVVAGYVVGSAIMLRSNLPKDVGSVISDALGAPLEAWRVEAWFNGLFLVSAALTALGIWAGNKSRDDDEEEFSEKIS